MYKFFPTNWFKWKELKKFHLNKSPSNSSKGFVFEFDLKYPKELWQLHNNYLLAPDKIKIKKYMLPKYQLMIIGNVKKLIANLFHKENYAPHYKNLQLYLRLGIKLKKVHPVWKFNQSQSPKPFVEFDTYKKIQAEKNGDKDGRALYKLMNNAVYDKTMENLRNWIDVSLVGNKKD